METTYHVFNESTKRLEPTSRDCSFCDNGTMESMETCYFNFVSLEKDRTNLVVYRSVSYNSVEIGIPRCKSCESVHSNALTMAVIITISSLIGYMYLLGKLIVSEAVGSTGGAIMMFVGVGAAVYGGMFLFNYLIRRKNVLTKLEGADNDETFTEFLAAGWTLGKPSA
jgi:hypothetical protein